MVFSRVAALMGFSRGGKKDKRGIKYIPDAVVRGALSWPLTLHDAALQQNVSIFPTTSMCQKAIGVFCVGKIMRMHCMLSWFLCC